MPVSCYPLGRGWAVIATSGLACPGNCPGSLGKGAAAKPSDSLSGPRLCRPPLPDSLLTTIFYPAARRQGPVVNRTCVEGTPAGPTIRRTLGPRQGRVSPLTKGLRGAWRHGAGDCRRTQGAFLLTMACKPKAGVSPGAAHLPRYIPAGLPLDCTSSLVCHSIAACAHSASPAFDVAPRMLASRSNTLEPVSCRAHGSPAASPDCSGKNSQMARNTGAGAWLAAAAALPERRAASSGAPRR